VSTLLAFDTSTEQLSIAVEVGHAVTTHESAGGALASATILPSILGLLEQAGVDLADLDAIAFGRGPGAFTGLRTACSVAQGLAFGAAKPVLPIDTLLSVAEDARGGLEVFRVWVAMDARMNEIYAAEYGFADGEWQVHAAPMLLSPAALQARWQAGGPAAVAGSALQAFDAALDTGEALRFESSRPRAAAMLPLARSLWRRGGAVDAALALPFYLRDKVAQTIDERSVAKSAREAEARAAS
jgi:tRNA threonylcarbamoyladenosine biosynthesis protein TsaB